MDEITLKQGLLVLQVVFLLVTLVALVLTVRNMRRSQKAAKEAREHLARTQRHLEETKGHLGRCRSAADRIVDEIEKEHPGFDEELNNYVRRRIAEHRESARMLFETKALEEAGQAVAQKQPQNPIKGACPICEGKEPSVVQGVCIHGYVLPGKETA